MDRDRRRFDDRRGGESYRPSDRSARSPSRGYEGRRRSPPRNRSRPRADTWVPSNRGFARPRSRSPPDYRRRSRTPPFQPRAYGQAPYGRRRTPPPRRFSPRRDERNRSPPPPSWRSRSPYSDGKPRDASRGRTSPRRARDISPGNQEVRPARRSTPTVPNSERNGRVLSPRAPAPVPVPAPVPAPQPTSIRPQSPSQPYRREQRTDMNSGRPSSRSRQASPNHPLASESNTTSRRSSPFNHAERGGLPPLQSRSRSPARHSPLYRSSGAGPPGRSPRLDQAQETPVVNHAKGPDSVERLPRKESSDQGPQGVPRLNRNIPTQPRNLVLNQTPPLGPSRGPPPHNRGPHNAPTLAAPTRPRHASGSRDGPWMGSPSMGPRRPSSIMPSHGAPSGPRASFSSPVPGGPGYRGHPGSRQGSSVGTLSPLTPKPPNYLAGLGSIVPGGRALPSALDVTTERRLAQLDADKEKLLEQMAATQKPRRAGLRDWDRLDRESSICALKSELAEGHLQRMADESIGGGVLY